ncbi:hypothetical protein HY479_04070 [Candidatus Uhrbacteria bacterium]|nr:hypothetical protein [Candidatus Uhrbacteria bacterium]
MKNLLLALLAVSSLGTGLFGVSTPARAAVIGSNVLIKGSGPAVYWVAENGKRYAFPNLKTFWSWFSSEKFNDVHVIGDQELAAIPFGGVVTYRPAAKLVKVASSPKVYAVSRYGVLRWVTTEAIAAVHYGPNWQTRVEDIPDAFFSTYTIGQPIAFAWEYNGGNEYNGVTNPSLNLLDNLPVDALSLSLSKYEVTKGEAAMLTAKLATNAQVQNIAIDIYGENKTLVKSCGNATTCAVQVALTGTDVTKTYTAQASYVTPSGPKKLDSNPVTLRLFLPQLSSQGSVLAFSEVLAPRNEQPVVRVVATAMNPTVLDSDLTIRIYRAKDNSLVKTCTGSVSCATNDTLVGITDATEVGYLAIANNSSNQALIAGTTNATVLPSGWYPSFNSYTFTANDFGTKTTLTSDIEQQSADATLEYAVVRSQGKDLKWSDENVAVAPGVPVHVEAKVNAGKPSDSFYVEIRETNGTVHKACIGTGTVTCSVDITYADEYKNHFFIIRVVDQNNRRRDFRLADGAYVGGKQGFGGRVRLITDKVAVKRGDTVYLSTKIMGENSPIAKLTTRIIDLETDRVILACNWTTECRTKTVMDSSLPSHRFYATVVDDKGREYHASFAPQPVTVMP